MNHTAPPPTMPPPSIYFWDFGYMISGKAFDFGFK